jgi:hypothetical protein
LVLSTPRVTVTVDWYLDRSGQKVAKFAIYEGKWTFATLPQAKELAHLDATNSAFKDLVPSHGWERLHFNLWLMHGRTPQGSQDVVITGFEYLPPPGT